MYRIIITTRAQKDYKEISKLKQEAVLNALEDIEEFPFISKPLSRDLTGRFSYKMGVYRIIYTIHKKDNTIRILSIGHRKSVYR